MEITYESVRCADVFLQFRNDIINLHTSLSDLSRPSLCTKTFLSALNCLLAHFAPAPAYLCMCFLASLSLGLFDFFRNEREADVRQTHGGKKATAQRTSSHLLLLFSSQATSAEDLGLYAIFKHD